MKPALALPRPTRCIAARPQDLVRRITWDLQRSARAQTAGRVHLRAVVCSHGRRGEQVRPQGTSHRHQSVIQSPDVAGCQLVDTFWRRVAAGSEKKEKRSFQKWPRSRERHAPSPGRATLPTRS